MRSKLLQTKEDHFMRYFSLLDRFCVCGLKSGIAIPGKSGCYNMVPNDLIHIYRKNPQGHGLSSQHEDNTGNRSVHPWCMNLQQDTQMSTRTYGTTKQRIKTKGVRSDQRRSLISSYAKKFQGDKRGTKLVADATAWKAQQSTI